ncbi:MAG: calcium-binding protein [Arthrospira sp. PLM2.Bin9]|nr:excalibur calcium-binding domain-containing protein [Arthrospira sp. PLM2.Bin9]TVU55431.1 MAG: calcium-binding protein [Arthrospira sp. PLM2.Bin9]
MKRIAFTIIIGVIMAVTFLVVPPVVAATGVPGNPTTKPIGNQTAQTATKTTDNSLAKCDPSYPDICIPPYPPDLNCKDISDRKFRVTGSDPHKFDRDRDGIGCEN